MPITPDGEPDDAIDRLHTAGESLAQLPASPSGIIKRVAIQVSNPAFPWRELGNRELRPTQAVNLAASRIRANYLQAHLRNNSQERL